MKKIALLTSVLMVLSVATLSAQMTDETSGLEFKISGSASVSFVMDLDVDGTTSSATDLGTGFVNAFATDVTLTFITKGTSETGADGDEATYGWIQLKDFAWTPDSDTNPPPITEAGVTAKIISGPLSVQIYGAPNVEIDKVTKIDNGLVAGDYDSTDGAATPAALTNGIIIGFDQDPIDLDIEFSSSAPAGSNSANSYALEATVGLGVDPLTITGVLALGFDGTSTNTGAWGNNLPLGFGAKVAIDLGELDPYFAFDGQSVGTPSEFDWEIGAGVQLDIGDGAFFYADAEVRENAPLASATSDTQIDLFFGFQDSGNTVTDSTEVAVPGVDILKANLRVLLTDVTDDLGYDVDVTGTLDFGDVDPYFKLGIADTDVSDTTESTVSATAGIKMAMISNTAFDLSWATDSLTAVGTATADLGAITFKTTITY
jgi:hypothetical protein